MTPNTELSDEQIVAAFLMRRPDWRLEGGWLIVGGGPAREVGDAIHKSDVIDAARAALSAVSRSEPVARLQAKDSDDGRRLGLFDIVILDRNRCHDDMLLYASPLPQEGKALTDEEVEPLFRQVRDMPVTPGGIKDEWFWFAWGVEMAERAHGIRPSATLKESSEAQGDQK